MDDNQFTEYCKKKLAMKQQRYDAISRSETYRHEWTCEECGSVLSWDGREARERHYKSRKHTQKAKGHIPK
jgi:hypothetical protein